MIDLIFLKRIFLKFLGRDLYAAYIVESLRQWLSSETDWPIAVISNVVCKCEWSSISILISLSFCCGICAALWPLAQPSMSKSSDLRLQLYCYQIMSLISSIEALIPLLLILLLLLLPCITCSCQGAHERLYMFASSSKFPSFDFKIELNPKN